MQFVPEAMELYRWQLLNSGSHFSPSLEIRQSYNSLFGFTMRGVLIIYVIVYIVLPLIHQVPIPIFLSSNNYATLTTYKICLRQSDIIIHDWRATFYMCMKLSAIEKKCIQIDR